LIINDTILETLFESITAVARTDEPEAAAYLEPALNTLMEIFAKKMKPVDKLNLLQILKVHSIIAQITDSNALSTQRFTPSYDSDLAEQMAKLVNAATDELVTILEVTHENDHLVSQAQGQLRGLLPYVLRYFSDEYDEICSTVVPSLTNFLTYVRKMSMSDGGKGMASGEYSSVLEPILQAVIAKMKYDDTSDWGVDDTRTEEAEFQELRKRLEVLQTIISAADDQLYIRTVQGVVTNAFEKLRSGIGELSWRDLDLALHEMYIFGSLAQKSGGLYNKNKPVTPAAEGLIAMLVMLVEIGK